MPGDNDGRPRRPRFGDDEESQVTKLGDLPMRRARSGRDRAYLIVIAGGNVGQTFRLEGNVTVIGRSSEAGVRLLDDNISRRHARIVADKGQMRIEDMGSANGTRVNGEPVQGTATLADGDKLELGTSTVLKFTYHDELDEEFQRSMYDAAQRDGLTRAFNKRYFLDRLATEAAYAKRHSTWLSLTLLDLDHFKKVNDTYGHLAGDAVLVQVASLIAATVRTEDVFARYGGEEFAIISRGIAIDGAEKLAERVRKIVFSMPTNHDSQIITSTVSVGVAAYPEVPGETREELIAAADNALYEAKRGGRDRVVRWRR